MLRNEKIGIWTLSLNLKYKFLWKIYANGSGDKFLLFFQNMREVDIFQQGKAFCEFIDSFIASIL